MISSLPATCSSRFSLSESKVPLAFAITGLAIAVISTLFLVSAFYPAFLPIEHTLVSVEGCSAALVGGVALAILATLTGCRKRCQQREIFRNPNFTFREISRPLTFENSVAPWPDIPDEVNLKILKRLSSVQDIFACSLVNRLLYNLCKTRWKKLTIGNGYIPLPKNPHANWKMLFFKHGGHFAQQILLRQKEGKKAHSLNSPRSSSYLSLEVGERFELEPEQHFIVVKKWSCFEIRDPKTGAVFRRFSYTDRVTCFKPEGKYLFCGLQNGAVEILNCDTGETKRVVKEADGEECRILEVTDTRLIATFKGGLIKIWDRTHFRFVTIPPLDSEKEVLELKVFEDTLMIGYSGKLIKIWDLSTHTLICDKKFDSKFEMVSLKFLKNKVVTQEKFNELIVWDYFTDTYLKIDSRDTFQDFCVFNRFIATIDGINPIVRLYDSETGELLERVRYRDVLRQPQNTRRPKLAVQGLLNMIFVASPVGGSFRSWIISNH